MIDIKQVKIDKSRRVIVLSDVHANLPLLQKLLQKVQYTREDYLFINGDLCEKGPDSLSTVAYVRDLVAESERVFVTKGNCDVLFRYVFDNVESSRTYMQRQPNSILNDMLGRYDKTLGDFATLEELGAFYRLHFRDELDWLESLPIAYETDEFIIVHAGIEAIPDWHKTSEEYALSVPAFYEKGHQADKIVVVGHWPVVNYRASSASSNCPIIDMEKRVIAMDGGNQIKRDGQLNAMLIEGNTFSYTYVDELKDTVICCDHQDETGRKGTVVYPNYALRVIEMTEFFTLCENTSLGICQWIKNEYIHGDKCIGDVSTTFLSVEKGEKVSIVNDECEGYSLVKKENGVVGWIPKPCLP